MRARLTFWVCFVLLWSAAGVPARGGPSQEPALKEQIEELVQALGGLTGWKQKRPVAFETIKRATLQKFLEDRIQQEAKPEEIAAEEMALKRFGFVPPEFDLRASTVALLTEQASAFYDYKGKKLYLLEGASDAERNTLMTHELAHALADQHFDVGRYLRKSANSDASLARLAVMEGQATWLMYELLAKKMGQSLQSSPELVEGMASGSAGLASQYPVLSSAPLYIRASLLFPYIAGLRFQNALVTKWHAGGFTAVYRRPPTSTAEILHPERYLAHEPVQSVSLPAAPARGKYATVSEGALGEFDHAILLEQFVSKSEAETLSPRFRAAQYRISRPRSGRGDVLVYRSEWQDEESAGQWFAAYQKVQRGKWKSRKVEHSSATEVSGTGDDGAFAVRWSGRSVLGVEGMSETAAVREFTTVQ